MADQDAPTFEQVGPDHPISKLANQLAARSWELASVNGMSQFDVCTAFANAIGLILGDSKDMPRQVALKRFKDLRKVMAAAYELSNVKGAKQ